MENSETPITLEEQVVLMKKMYLSDSVPKCGIFYCMPDISEQADMENFCSLM